MTNKIQFDKLIKLVFKNQSTGLDKKYSYHSPRHICMVFRDSTFLGHKLNLSVSDMILLQTAASMHDYGFVISHEKHEERSCIEARKLLPEYGYSKEDIEIICGMIMATKIPQTPKTLLEKIICDADLYYLGCNYYFEIADHFKGELVGLDALKDENHWKEIQINFLENHEYHLPYTQKLLNETKQKNLNILKNIDGKTI